jgi:hypothetical protein
MVLAIRVTALGFRPSGMRPKVKSEYIRIDVELSKVLGLHEFNVLDASISDCLAVYCKVPTTSDKYIRECLIIKLSQ